MANGPQVAGDPVPAGKDLSAAPMQTASPDTARPAPPGTGDASATRPAPEGGKVRLAPVHPLGQVTLPPLEDGGETIVITPDGTEVDAQTAKRAHEAAHAGGYRLREL